MVRTRVGYSGGTKKDPTYVALGDHTETFQVDFDPSKVTYADLLDLFWKAHDPTVKCSSRQYAPIIFVHDATQKALAQKSLADEQKKRGTTIHTEIRAASTFYLAEGYHQKYYLSLDAVMLAEIRRHYPDGAGLIGSTAAARLNGYVGGYGTKKMLAAEIDALGLTSTGRARLLSLVTK